MLFQLVHNTQLLNILLLRSENRHIYSRKNVYFLLKGKQTQHLNVKVCILQYLQKKN